MDYHSKQQMARIDECCKAADTGEPSSIAMAISAIQMALGRLEDNLGKLSGRLEPVLRQSSPTPAANGDCESFPVGCKVANELRAAHAKITSLADCLGETARRVDL